MALTNAQLAQQVSELVNYWRTRDVQFAEWLGGTPAGGPYGDGRYPLTDYLGVIQYLFCPAALESGVTSSASSAATQAALSGAAKDSALAAKSAAEAAAVNALAYRDAAQAARDLALQYRDGAANSQAVALTHRNKAKDWASQSVDVVVESGLYSARHYAIKASESTTGAGSAKVAAEAARDAAQGHASNASASAADAAASALAAQTWNPANYAALAAENAFVGSSTAVRTHQFTNTETAGTLSGVRLSLSAGPNNAALFLTNASYGSSVVTGGPTGSQAVLRTLGNYPIIFGTSNAERVRIDGSGYTTFRNPIYIETSGSTSTTRNIEFKSAGQANVGFGSYAGAWRPTLTIQGDTNAQHLSLVAGAVAGEAARIFSTHSLDVYSGGNLAATFASNGYFQAASWLKLSDSDGVGLFNSRGYYIFPGTTGDYRWNMRSAHATASALVLQDSAGNGRTWLYASGADFGILNGAGSWALQMNASSAIFTNNTYAPEFHAQGFRDRNNSGYYIYNVSASSSYTYGSFRLGGAKGGYCGIVLDDSGRRPTFMSNGTASGIYNQGGSYWDYYNDGTRFRIGRLPYQDYSGSGGALLHLVGGQQGGRVFIQQGGTPAGTTEGDITLIW